MKKLLFGILLAVVGWTLKAAEIGAKSEVRDAIRALAGQASYSWTSTSRAAGSGAGSQQGLTDGQTEKDGYTYFRLTLGDNVVEASFRGNKSAIKTEGDWESSDEIKGEREWIARRLKTFQVPAAEAEDLLAKVTFLRKEQGGLYSADLTGAGVRDLLMARSRTAGQTDGPRNTKGWVKFWVKSGALARYEYNVQGKVIGQDLQEHDVNQTTTLEIKAVGTTKVRVPDGAKKKLSWQP